MCGLSNPIILTPTGGWVTKLRLKANQLDEGEHVPQTLEVEGAAKLELYLVVDSLQSNFAQAVLRALDTVPEAWC